MTTQKLYWSDPFATTFEAKGRLAELGGRGTVVLDRTLFCPESGGQLADAGTLVASGRTLQVEDVQMDDRGEIHHVIVDPPEVLADAAIQGTIDPARRRDHMVQHTAQHALSRALVDVARADTVSSRLGSSICTIDVEGTLSERDAARAEDVVNAVVTGDVAVRQLFPAAEELAGMPLRRAPKVDQDVRIIEIDGFDLSPCGGTHCTRTGQIGLVRVVGLERYKGGWRVSFHAGRRALDDVRRKEAVLAELARDFTCGMLDIGQAVTKLRGDLKARLDSLSSTRGELVELLAQRVLAMNPADPTEATRILLLRERDDIAMLRTLAGRLTERRDVVAFCASPDGRSAGDWSIVVQRGAAARFDCAGWLKRVTEEHGGRGGGRPERAEGRLPRTLDRSRLQELVRKAPQPEGS